MKQRGEKQTKPFQNRAEFHPSLGSSFLSRVKTQIPRLLI